MSDFEIRTRTFGQGGLLPVRRVVCNGKTLTTPAKPSPAERLTGDESIDEAALEAVELYTQIDTGLLREARRDPGVSIVDRFGANRVPDTAMVFPFVSFQDGHTISEGEAEQIADAIMAVGDFATLPLQPELADAVEPSEGLSDAAYQSYRVGAERSLKAIEAHPKNLSKMAVLPKLGWAYLEDLLDLYAEYDVETFCLNLDRRRITAARQVGVLRPLSRYFVERDMHEETLIYGINLDPRDRELIAGVYPAANVAAFGLGIDIVGETHVPPRGPPEMFEPEEGEVQEELPQTFTLFRKEEWTAERIALEDLADEWPSDSSFDVDRALERARAGGAAKSRVEALVNAEQMALAARELREELLEGDVLAYIESKDGITEAVVEAFRQVRESFDDAQDQSGLSDFL